MQHAVDAVLDATSLSRVSMWMSLARRSSALKIVVSTSLMIGSISLSAA